MIQTRHPSRRMVLAGLAATAATPVFAQTAADYPKGPIRVICSAAAGGGNDLIARIVAERLQAKWGQNVVVENRPGAGNNLATEQVYRAPPDGYTLLVSPPAPLVVNAVLFKELRFDPKKIEPVAITSYIPNVLVVGGKSPFKTAQEFIAFARANPNKLSYASQGNGTTGHLTGALFEELIQSKQAHVPFGGAAPALNDVAAGHVPLMMVDIGPALGAIQGGSVRALGVSTTQRFPTLPDVPPIGDTVPGFDAAGWFMVAAPSGLPPAIAEKLHGELDKFLSEKTTSEEIVRSGFQPLQNKSLSSLSKFVVSEIARWTDVVRKAGVEGAF